MLISNQRVAEEAAWVVHFTSQLLDSRSTTDSFCTFSNFGFYDCFDEYSILTYYSSGTNASGTGSDAIGKGSYDFGISGRLFSTYLPGGGEAITRHIDGNGISSTDVGGDLCWIGSGEKAEQESPFTEE